MGRNMSGLMEAAEAAAESSGGEEFRRGSK